MAWGNYYHQDTIDELLIKNKSKQKNYLKKHADAKPVILNGGTICTSWWGKSWNKNFKRYADFDNRLSRGSKYCKANCILDLKIKAGLIEGVIAGSGRSIYNCTIKVKPLPKETWEVIVAGCNHRFDSIDELLAGKFPKQLADLFFDLNNGLFPKPKEITIDCSCPDYAVLCKHSAALLYAVSHYLDENPEILFTLRSVDINDLIHESLQQGVDSLIKKANSKSSRILNDVDIEQVFNLD